MKIWLSYLAILLAVNLNAIATSAQATTPSFTVYSTTLAQKLGPGKLGTTNYRNIKKMHPMIQSLAFKAVSELSARKLHVQISSNTYRTFKKQDELFEKGYSGARGGESYHNFGLALDITPVVVQGSKWNTKGFKLKGKYLHVNGVKLSAADISNPGHITLQGKKINKKDISLKGDRLYLLWAGLKIPTILRDWETKAVPVFRRYGFTWGNDKNATHIAVDPAHFQTGLKLRKKKEDKTSVKNILLEKRIEREVFTLDSREYPKLERKDFLTLGGKLGVNRKLLQLLDF